MLNAFYDIFIGPLVWAMDLVLSHAYDLCHSYGVAIIILSLVVNTALLPIYHIADHWQDEERKIQDAMSDKVDEIKSVFKGQERFMMLKTLYRQHSYHPIMAVRNSVGFLIQVPFFFAAYTLLSHYPELNGQSFFVFSDLGKPDALISLGALHINLMPFVMTVINLFSASIYTQGLKAKDKIQLYVFAAVFLVLLYTSPVGLVLYWTFNNIYSLLKNIVYKHLPETTTNAEPNKIEKTQRKHNNIRFLLVLTAIFTLIYLYVPVATYVSDTEFFVISSKELIISYLSTSFWGLMILGLLHNALSTKNQRRLFNVALFWGIVFTINVFIKFLDGGVVDQYLVTTTFGNRIQRTFFDTIVILITALILFILKKKASEKRLNELLGIACVSLLLMSGIKLTQQHSNAPNTASMESIEESRIGDDLVPNYAKELLTFSKNEKNIVVIMLDMFSGQHMEHYFEENPEAKNELSGFTWYHNSLSSGDVTLIGEHGIHGGPMFTPYEINKRSNEIASLEDEAAKAYGIFAKSFAPKGYEVRYFGAQNASCEAIKSYTGDALTSCQPFYHQYDFVDLYKKNIGWEKAPVEIDQALFLRRFGLFNAVPYALKKVVYQKGRWNGGVDLHYMEETLLEKPAVLHSLPMLSSVKTKQATFKYLQVDPTHTPFAFDKETCQIDVNIIEKGRATKGEFDPAHYAAEYCSMQLLTKWFDWMKKEGIYDNTMIVLVSDHSYDDSSTLTEALGGYFEAFGNRSPNLLMVKEFNAKHPVKYSNAFVSNADVPSIVCATIGGCEGIPKDPRLTDTSKRELYYMEANPSMSRHNLTSYVPKSLYKVTGDMYKKENWQELNTQQEKPKNAPSWWQRIWQQLTQ